MENITFYKLQYIREKETPYGFSKDIYNAREAHDIFEIALNLTKESEEVLAMLVLNTKSQVIGAFEVSRGSINSSIVHPREVYKRALLLNGSKIMLAHNHLSGDPTPSREDINVTARMREAGKILGIELLDHMILGEGRYVSLREKGYL